MTDCPDPLEELGRMGWVAWQEDGRWYAHPGPDIDASTPERLLAKARLRHAHAIPDHPALRIKPGTVTKAQDQVPQQRARQQ